MGGVVARSPASRRRPTRVEIGPLVACTAFHNPAVLAKQADTIDEISGGRLILGLGAGWNEVGVPRLRLPVRGPDRAVRGGVHDHPNAAARTGAIDSPGGTTRRGTASWSRAARAPAARRSWSARAGRGCCAITAPHVDAWNAWYADTRTARTASGRLREVVDDAARAAGRAPSDIERTVAVQVRMPGGTGRLRWATRTEAGGRAAFGEPAERG